MTTNYVPLDKNQHSALKVNLKHKFEFATQTHLAAATLREFAQLATTMPIVFVKDPQAGSLHSIAMFGLEQGKNLYFHDDRWQTHILPLSIQRFPFDVRPDGDKLGVFIDVDSDLVSETEGEALFTEEGEPSPFLQNRHKMLSDIANSEMANQRFLKKIEELNLLDEITLLVQYANGQKRNVTGLFSISEKRLNELDKDVFAELRSNGFLAGIYSALISLGQINRIVQLSAQSDMPIASVQLSLGKTEEKAAD